jgi:hypothetical protein
MVYLVVDISIATAILAVRIAMLDLLRGIRARRARAAIDTANVGTRARDNVTDSQQAGTVYSTGRGPAARRAADADEESGGGEQGGASAAEYRRFAYATADEDHAQASGRLVGLRCRSSSRSSPRRVQAIEGEGRRPLSDSMSVPSDAGFAEIRQVGLSSAAASPPTEVRLT